jgi:hypothetical protein
MFEWWYYPAHERERICGGAWTTGGTTRYANALLPYPDGAPTRVEQGEPAGGSYYRSYWGESPIPAGVYAAVEEHTDEQLRLPPWSIPSSSGAATNVVSRGSCQTQGRSPDGGEFAGRRLRTYPHPLSAIGAISTDAPTRWGMQKLVSGPHLGFICARRVRGWPRYSARRLRQRDFRGGCLGRARELGDRVRDAGAGSHTTASDSRSETRIARQRLAGKWDRLVSEREV